MSNKQKRENGFYWARYDDEWIVIEWRDTYWLKTGSELPWRDCSFDEILLYPVGRAT